MRLCSSCSAQIFWAKTTAGKAMPIDAKPVEDGNVWLDANQVASVGKPVAGSLRYVSHFATCKNAAKHRKGKDQT